MAFQSGFDMLLVFFVAGLIGLLWLTQMLIRRGMDDGSSMD